MQNADLVRTTHMRVLYFDRGSIFMLCQMLICVEMAYRINLIEICLSHCPPKHVIYHSLDFF